VISLDYTPAEMAALAAGRERLAALSKPVTRGADLVDAGQPHRRDGFNPNGGARFIPVSGGVRIPPRP
jgi:hypothetical protein